MDSIKLVIFLGGALVLALSVFDAFQLDHRHAHGEGSQSNAFDLGQTHD